MEQYILPVPKQQYEKAMCAWIGFTNDIPLTGKKFHDV